MDLDNNDDNPKKSSDTGDDKSGDERFIILFCSRLCIFYFDSLSICYP